MPNKSPVAGVGLVKVQVGVELNGRARDGAAQRSAAIAIELRAEAVATHESTRTLIVECWELACIGLNAVRKRGVIVLVSVWGSRPRCQLIIPPTSETPGWLDGVEPTIDH